MGLELGLGLVRLHSVEEVSVGVAEQKGLAARRAPASTAHPGSSPEARVAAALQVEHAVAAVQMAHAEVGLTPRRARTNPRPADAHEVGRGGEAEARVLELGQRVVGEELEAELVAVRPWLGLGVGLGLGIGAGVGVGVGVGVGLELALPLPLTRRRPHRGCPAR